MPAFLSVRHPAEWAVGGEQRHTVERWWSRDGETVAATVCGWLIHQSRTDRRRREAPTCQSCAGLVGYTGE